MAGVRGVWEQVPPAVVGAVLEEGQAGPGGGTLPARTDVPPDS